MLVVLPFHEGDKWLAIKTLDWAKKLDGGKVDFDCLLVSDNKTDSAPVIPLAGEYFRSVHELKIDVFPGDQTWPRGANYLWRQTANWLYDRFEWPTGSQHWLWWEPDATPIKKGWLKTLNDEGIAGGKPFCGAMTEGGYMAGVGIYPRQVCHYSQDAFVVAHVPFDIVLGRKAARYVHPAQHLIQHIVSPTGETFDDRGQADALLNESTVLFHKCKDGSLIDVLSGAHPRVTVPNKGQPHKLSWTQQTDWPCGFFHFPATPSVCTVYFNPTLATWNGADYLIPRRWVQFKPGMWKSDIGLCRIGKNMVLTDISFPKIPATVENENWEDPRAVVHDGTLYMSCVTWGGPNWRLVKMHQVFSKVVGNKLEVVCHPIYGFNRATLKGNDGNEKNWTWFNHEGAWHFVYQLSPDHRVVRYGTNLKEWTGKVKTGEMWHYGDMRGGACPVRVGNEYFCFVHSSLPSKINRRTYFMGAYAFEAEPPFEITRMTTEPMLTASHNDPHVYGGPSVIWPGGSLLRDGEWLLSLGVNDEACGWIKILHDDVIARMEFV